jgi:hypothetical protein
LWYSSFTESAPFTMITTGAGASPSARCRYPGISTPAYGIEIGSIASGQRETASR